MWRHSCFVSLMKWIQFKCTKKETKERTFVRYQTIHLVCFHNMEGALAEGVLLDHKLYCYTRAGYPFLIDMGHSDTNTMEWSQPKGETSSWTYFRHCGLTWQPVIQTRQQYVTGELTEGIPSSHIANISSLSSCSYALERGGIWTS